MAKQDFTAGQVLTAAQMDSLQANDYNWTVSTKTDSYTLVAADAGTRVVMNAATAKTITVNSGVFAAGDIVWIHNINTGTCTVTAGTCTVNTEASLALGQWGGGTLYFTSGSTAIFFRSSLGAIPIEYLVIAGGGGGGAQQATNGSGGGGGAGGYRTNKTGQTSGGGASAEPSFYASQGATFTVTVGAGGATRANASAQAGADGSNSVFAVITSLGGGGGGSQITETSGRTGGSGGGGKAYVATDNGGAGTTGQGYRGGRSNTGGQEGGAGGGGGAGGVGQTGTTNGLGVAGIGVSSNITGSSVTRAVGGEGGDKGNVVVAAGGGANTGGGGGGGSNGNTTTGPNAGSGVVIIAYETKYPAITTIGAGLTYSVDTSSRTGYRVYTFTAGTDTVTF